MATSKDAERAETRAIVRKNMIAFRKEMGSEVTQQVLADLAGLSIEAIRGYEQGRRVPDWQALTRLGGVMGRSMDDFFSPTPPPPNTMDRPVVALRVLGRLDWDLLEDLKEALAVANDEMRHRLKNNFPAPDRGKGALRRPPEDISFKRSLVAEKLSDDAMELATDRAARLKAGGKPPPRARK